jgi:hypothetical protein
VATAVKHDNVQSGSSGGGFIACLPFCVLYAAA